MVAVLMSSVHWLYFREYFLLLSLLLLVFWLIVFAVLVDGCFFTCMAAWFGLGSLIDKRLINLFF